MDRFLLAHQPPTPCLIIDLDIVRIQYRIRTPHEGGACESAILAGPTCDSMDMIYERADYRLPLDLAIGDPLDSLSAGAYTASCAAVEFNGFPPIRTHCI